MGATSELATSISEPGEEERRSGKPLLQGKLEEMGLNGRWDENFTKVLDHLTPEAGGILNDFWKRFLTQFGCILNGFGEAWAFKNHEKPLEGLQKSENR